MKNTLGTIVGILVGIGGAHAATITGTDDLRFIAGSGANFATLIIDFNDGAASESFAWGFRWDGVASGEDMITTIAAADPNLTIDSGVFVGMVSYTAGGILHAAASDFTTAFAFWGYYVAGGFAGDDDVFDGMVGTPTAVAGGGETLPESWTESPTGASLESFGESGRILSDGAWDAWSFGPYNTTTFAHEAPPGPEAPIAATIPEPSALLLWSVFMIATVTRRRR